MLARIASRSGPLYGVDLNTAYLVQARRKVSSACLIASDAASLPFSDASFGVTLCVQASLGLLGEKKLAALREMARVTRRGGQIVVVVYSEQSIPSRLDWYRELHRLGLMAAVDPEASKGLITATSDGHRSEAFTRQRFASLLREAGLKAEILPVGTFYYAGLAGKP